VASCVKIFGEFLLNGGETHATSGMCDHIKLFEPGWGHVLVPYEAAVGFHSATKGDWDVGHGVCSEVRIHDQNSHFVSFCSFYKGEHATFFKVLIKAYRSSPYSSSNRSSPLNQYQCALTWLSLKSLQKIGGHVYIRPRCLPLIYGYMLILRYPYLLKPILFDHPLLNIFHQSLSQKIILLLPIPFYSFRYVIFISQISIVIKRVSSVNSITKIFHDI